MIGTTEIIRYGMIAAGVFIMLSSLWYHSVRKLTVNFAIAWEILSIILIAAGIFQMLSSWACRLSTGTGAGIVFLGAVCLWGGFQFSILVSHLAMKNRELAMQVSLLMQEDAKMAEQLQALEDRMREYEENFVCD